MVWEIHFGRGFVLIDSVGNGPLHFATKEQAIARADELRLPDVVIKNYTPTVETKAAMREAGAGNVTRFATVEDLMADLNDDKPLSQKWVIRGADQYRVHDRNGTVLDMFTMEPRTFASENEAKDYARLSQFTGDTVVEVYRP